MIVGVLFGTFASLFVAAPTAFAMVSKNKK